MAVGVAAAAPAVDPPRFEWVCTADGNGHGKLLVQDGGTPLTQAHSAQCALCLLVAPPPSLRLEVAAARPEPVWASPRLPQAPPASRPSAPLPPRGPPPLS